MATLALGLESLLYAYKAAERLWADGKATVRTLYRWLRDGLSVTTLVDVSVLVVMMCRWLASLLRLEVAIITIVTIDMAALLLVCCARGRWHDMRQNVSRVFTSTVWHEMLVAPGRLFGNVGTLLTVRS